MNAAAKHELVEQVPFWYHSMDFGDGVVSTGYWSAEDLRLQVERMKLPDLAGRTVLDIGAWDGFFSYEAERRGASRVLALDHYVWSLNLDRQQDYWRMCKNSGTVPSQYDLVPGLWQPGTLPGKQGFDTAHRIKESKVEQKVADFMTGGFEEVGSFDVVFFLGVLYHMREPLRALTRVALFTRELAIIETAAIQVPGREHEALVEFYETNELGADVSNWWAPSLPALVKMCRAAGFRRVDLVGEYPLTQHVPLPPDPIRRYRVTVHAWR